jgi:hypothetical protein
MTITRCRLLRWQIVCGWGNGWKSCELAGGERPRKKGMHLMLLNSDGDFCRQRQRPQNVRLAFNFVDTFCIFLGGSCASDDSCHAFRDAWMAPGGPSILPPSGRPLIFSFWVVCQFDYESLMSSWFHNILWFLRGLRFPPTYITNRPILFIELIMS